MLSRVAADADLTYRSVRRAAAEGRLTLVATRPDDSRFLDGTARRRVDYRYRIKAVNRDGTTSWFGPVRVA